MKLDLTPLREREEKGLIRSQTHPTLPLIIWNYSEQTQFTKAWDEYTLMCRGLITDTEGNIIARPFKKFFNYEEHTGPLPDGTPEIIEKVDGSLGIMFWYGDAWHIATRGSFTSEQSEYARSVLLPRIGDLLDGWPKDHTHLWEIIFPSNRIVCDYGGWEGLVYLGSVNNEDATEIGIECTPSETIRVPARIGYLGTDLLGLKALEQPDKEGFVLRWPNGFRLKIKFEEYKRLHRILTGVSNIAIWEMLRDRKPLNEILEKVPDEFYQWVRETKEDLENQYNIIKAETEALLQHYDKGERFIERKEWAKYILNDGRWPGVAFAILDKKDPHEMIMRIIRPKFSKPFKHAET